MKPILENSTICSPANPTPILDRQAPMPPPAKPGSGSRLFITIWAGLWLGLVTTWMIWRPPFIRSLRWWILSHYAQMFPDDWTGTRIITVGLTMAAVFLGAVAIHEGGHAVAGIAAGFRFISMRVGRIQINRPFRISRYRGSGAGSGGWVGGWVNLLPASTEKLRLRAVVMVLAGPGGNLLSAYIVLLLPYSKGFASMFFIFFSLVLGLINLVPFRSQAVLSDGMRILMLLWNRGRGERWLAMMKLGAELNDGVAPESLSADFLAKAVALQDNSPDTVGAHAIAYTAAFWQHKDAEAAQLLETCLKYSSYAAPIQREALMSSASVFQARRRKRADLAEQWLAAMPKTTEISWLRSSAETGILEAKGDIEGALKKLDDVERMVLAEPNEARRKVSLQSLQRWKAELRKELAPPATAEAAF